MGPQKTSESPWQREASDASKQITDVIYGNFAITL